MRGRLTRRAGGGTAIGCAAVALSACATLVYHPYDEETRTGHLARQVGDVTFHVEFLGERDRVSMDAARRHVTRRCAELARAHGKRAFRLAEGHGDYDTSLYRHDEPGHATCYGAGLGHVAAAQCALRRDEVRYERRADRVRYRALCELTDQLGSPGARAASAELEAAGAR